MEKINNYKNFCTKILCFFIKFYLILIICFLCFGCTKNDKAKIYSLSGYLSWKQNDWNDAVLKFLKALELGSQIKNEDIIAYSNYGIASTYLMQNEDHSALIRFQNIKNTQDKYLHSSILYQKGIIAFKAKKYEESALLFKKSLEETPDRIDAKINYELSKKYLEKQNNINKTIQSSGITETGSEDISDNAIIDLIRRKEKAKCQNMEQEQKPAAFDY